MDIVNVFLSILGIGFLIFAHELGHFLAAKKVGIRVDTFALGFQPTIFGWRARLLAIRRGETLTQARTRARCWRQRQRSGASRA